jgi:8-oxo-dGTP pyrophosphatase MutT (NUDIX family)
MECEGRILAFGGACNLMTVQPSPAQAQCLRIARCTLRVADWQWPLTQRHGPDIGRDWQRRRAEIPGLFDGTTYLLCQHTIVGASLSGILFKTDFKTLLYWRGLPQASDEPVREAFGASLIRSAEGHLLLGRQGPGQLNSGRVYPPGGLIDGDDVENGGVDIDASVTRELAEETGLTPSELQRVPGYLVAQVGLKVAIAIEWRSALATAELRDRILGFVRSQAEPELDDIVPVRSYADIDEFRTPPHARALVRTVLSA